VCAAYLACCIHAALLLTQHLVSSVLTRTCLLVLRSLSTKMVPGVSLEACAAYLRRLAQIAAWTSGQAELLAPFWPTTVLYCTALYWPTTVLYCTAQYCTASLKLSPMLTCMLDIGWTSPMLAAGELPMSSRCRTLTKALVASEHAIAVLSGREANGRDHMALQYNGVY
jgi:hypothetical protein